jgi:hypothetical protein
MMEPAEEIGTEETPEARMQLQEMPPDCQAL